MSDELHYQFTFSDGETDTFDASQTPSPNNPATANEGNSASSSFDLAVANGLAGSGAAIGGVNVEQNQLFGSRGITTYTDLFFNNEDIYVGAPVFSGSPSSPTLLTGTFTASVGSFSGTLSVTDLSTDTGTSTGSGGQGTTTPPTTAVVLGGTSSQYTIYALGDGTNGTVQDNAAGSTDSQGLSGPTDLTFSNGSGVFDPTGNAEEVARLYQAAFDRTSDLSGLDYWTGQLNSGTLGLAGVAQGFISSAEFQTAYGALDNQDFVQTLYQNVLGRPGDTSGVQYWTGQLVTGESRANVLLGFSDSIENKTGTLSTVGDKDLGEAYRLYQAAFNRTPDAAGLDFWAQSLDSGATPLAVAQGFVNSPEFAQAYAGDDATAYVTQLYNNVLYRAPDAAGEQYWVGQLNSGASQAQVLLGFSDSTENRAATAGATHDGWVFLGHNS